MGFECIDHESLMNLEYWFMGHPWVSRVGFPLVYSAGPWTTHGFRVLAKGGPCTANGFPWIAP